MAKKSKDAAASAKKEVKAKAPTDPVKTRNLVRLLNILALLLAIAAFLLQLFAVLSHHWKWQKTALHPIMSPTYHYSQPYVYEDSRLEQNYGLFSRDVKVYGKNDEQLDVWGSTRFPRIEYDNENNYHQCLSQTSTLRGAVLTCSDRVVSPPLCNCRRYTYWNVVIVFEIIALILLGIVVFLTALLTTQFHGILKLAAAGLALLAFILLLIGLILILSHLKRETRSFADAYPHIYQKLAAKLGVDANKNTAYQPYPSVLRRAITRRDVLHNTLDHYRAYALAPGQHPYNETHYQEYSDYDHVWVYKPYSGLASYSGYAPSQTNIASPSYVPNQNVRALAPGQHPYNETHYQEYSDYDRAWVHKPYSGLASYSGYAPSQTNIASPSYVSNQNVRALAPGQYPYNETHYLEYSDYDRAWVYKPYSGLVSSIGYAPSQTNIASPSYVSNQNVQAPSVYAPRSQQRQEYDVRPPARNTTVAPVVPEYNTYGPVLGYNTVFDNTRAGIGWSTILSIIAMVLALLLPLLLIFSWLTSKKLGPDTKTITKTTTTEYVTIPQHDVTVQPVVARQIPVDYDYKRPIGEALVTAQNVRQGFRDIPITQPVPQQVAIETTTPKPYPPHYDPHHPIGESIVAHNIRPGPYDILVNQPAPQQVNIETKTPKPYPPHYDPHHPSGESIVAHNIRPGPYDILVNQPEHVIVRNVMIPDESSVKQTTTTTTTRT